MWNVVWTALFVVALVWIAAVLLAIRDRLKFGSTTAPCPAAVHSVTATAPAAEGWRDLTVGRRLLLALLTPIVLPIGAVILAILLGPFFLWQVAGHAFYSARFRLFGVPIPRQEPPDVA